MGAGCCTTGTSEKETLLLTLEWGSGWASTMAKDLMVLRECIRNICSYGCCYRNLSNNHDGETVNELSAKLDSIKVLLSGLVKNLDCSYRDEDEDVLSNLLNSFDNAKKQCKGELPIAVNRIDRFDSAVSYLKEAATATSLKDYKVLCVDGNEDYWRTTIRKSPWDALKVIEESATSILSKDSEEDGKTPKKILFLFENRDVLEFMKDNKMDCRAYNKFHGMTLLQAISEKYEGCKFFYRHEVAKEFTKLCDDSPKTIGFDECDGLEAN